MRIGIVKKAFVQQIFFLIDFDQWKAEVIELNLRSWKT